MSRSPRSSPPRGVSGALPTALPCPPPRMSRREGSLCSRPLLRATAFQWRRRQCSPSTAHIRARPLPSLRDVRHREPSSRKCRLPCRAVPIQPLPCRAHLHLLCRCLPYYITDDIRPVLCRHAHVASLCRGQGRRDELTRLPHGLSLFPCIRVGIRELPCVREGCRSFPVRAA